MAGCSGPSSGGEPDLADVPVIVLSAMRDLTAKIQTLEPAGVFAKPFDLELLLATIERLTS